MAELPGPPHHGGGPRPGRRPAARGARRSTWRITPAHGRTAHRAARDPRRPPDPVPPAARRPGVPEPPRRSFASPRRTGTATAAWLAQAAKVRPDLAAFPVAVELRRAGRAGGRGHAGHRPGARTTAGRGLRAGTPAAPGPHMAGATSPATRPAGPVAGFVVDAWTETIPAARTTSGIAVHFDSPSAAAPNAVLLAVTRPGQEFGLDASAAASATADHDAVPRRSRPTRGPVADPVPAGGVPPARRGRPGRGGHRTVTWLRLEGTDPRPELDRGPRRPHRRSPVDADAAVAGRRVRRRGRRRARASSPPRSRSRRTHGVRARRGAPAGTADARRRRPPARGAGRAGGRRLTTSGSRSSWVGSFLRALFAPRLARERARGAARGLPRAAASATTGSIPDGRAELELLARRSIDGARLAAHDAPPRPRAGSRGLLGGFAGGRAASPRGRVRPPTSSAPPPARRRGAPRRSSTASAWRRPHPAGEVVARRRRSTAAGRSTGTTSAASRTRSPLSAGGQLRDAPDLRAARAARFQGMPAARFWAIEDDTVSFGDLAAGPEDLVRAIVGAFAATYANDWFVVPCHSRPGRSPASPRSGPRRLRRRGRGPRDRSGGWPGARVAVLRARRRRRHRAAARRSCGSRRSW